MSKKLEEFVEFELGFQSVDDQGNHQTTPRTQALDSVGYPFTDVAAAGTEAGSPEAQLTATFTQLVASGGEYVDDYLATSFSLIDENGNEYSLDSRINFSQFVSGNRVITKIELNEQIPEQIINGLEYRILARVPVASSKSK